MSIRTIPRVLKSAVRGFYDHDVMTLGAGLAFYTMLSLAPLLVLLVLATGYLGEEIQGQIVNEMIRLAGPEAGGTIRTVLKSAALHRQTGLISSLIGLAGVLLSATAAFGHLHKSLNTIWGVRGERRSAVGGWLRGRAISLVMMVLVAAFVFLSIGANTILSLIPFKGTLAGRLREVGGTFVIYAALFALVFKVVPLARVRWGDALVGAGLTAGLFLAGNRAIRLYFAHAGVGTAYGAAGSLFVFLVYVYYVSVIVFFGAEVTRSWAERRQGPIEIGST